MDWIWCDFFDIWGGVVTLGGVKFQNTKLPYKSSHEVGHLQFGISIRDASRH